MRYRSCLPQELPSVPLPEHSALLPVHPGASDSLLPLPPQEKSPRDKAAAEREDNTHLFVNRENIKKKIFFKDSDSVRRVNT